jgi:hypothetical protein
MCRHRYKITGIQDVSEGLGHTCTHKIKYHKTLQRPNEHHKSDKQYHATAVVGSPCVGIAPPHNTHYSLYRNKRHYQQGKKNINFSMSKQAVMVKTTPMLTANSNSPRQGCVTV